MVEGRTADAKAKTANTVQRDDEGGPNADSGMHCTMQCVREATETLDKTAGLNKAGQRRTERNDRAQLRYIEA